RAPRDGPLPELREQPLAGGVQVAQLAILPEQGHRLCQAVEQLHPEANAQRPRREPEMDRVGMPEMLAEAGEAGDLGIVEWRLADAAHRAEVNERTRIVDQLGGSEITAAVRDEVVAVEGTRLDVRVVEVLVAADPQARFGRHDERKLRIRGAVETHVVGMRLGGDPPSEHEELDLLARMPESHQVGAPELEGARQLVDPRLPVIVPAM